VSAPRPVDEARAKPFLVVEKNLQNMFGRKLLVPFADGERLGALDETARPFGIFFDVHRNLPFAKHPYARGRLERPPVPLRILRLFSGQPTRGTGATAATRDSWF
jgi:hypothetical protein